MTAESYEKLVQSGIELGHLTGAPDWATDPALWDNYIAALANSIANPLPRLHRRLKVPPNEVARMMVGLQDAPAEYQRYLLPPTVQRLAAVDLQDSKIFEKTREVIVHWNDIVDGHVDFDGDTIGSLLESDAWISVVDPDDFQLGTDLSASGSSDDPTWRNFDASTRSALASLPEHIPTGERLAVLLGLWSSATRQPKLPEEWTRSKEWIEKSEHVVETQFELAAARVWALSTSGPLHDREDNAKAIAFCTWAFRRAGTWPSFVSPDPDIHRRLFEEPLQEKASGLWPTWVIDAVNLNRIPEPRRTRVSVVHRAPKVEELLDELDALVGLESVKAEIHSIVKLAQLEQTRAGLGMNPAPIDMNLVLTGNPGTGKTTVARLYGQILRAAGVLTSSAFIEVSRADLVGPYKSEASQRTRKALESAEGGVFFIDEAYALADQGADRDGREVISELVAYMEKHHGSIAIVVAGYAGPMSLFMDSNPGLNSRFKEPLLFPDLNDQALLDALLLLAKKESYNIEPNAIPALTKYIKAMPRDLGFGNVRAMRNVLAQLKQNLAQRYSLDREIPPDLITLEDVPLIGPGEVDEAAYDQAIAKLDMLIGLEPAKKTIKSLADQARLVQRRLEEGDTVAPITVGHMVFEGNPGTGKTTAAATMGQILASLGLLRSGHVHVVSHADLIGQYLGQTAPKVRAAVKQALDGVLFIDEAYSLTARKDHDSYSREAVITLVDEIERNRARLVVVMAGYPEEMEFFLKSNVGLKSRVRHTINFPNFSQIQLREIAISAAKAHHMDLTKAAADAVSDRAAAVSTMPGFANARTVRNLIDDAVAKHASRVQALNPGDVTGADLRTIELVDIGEVKLVERVPIGFAV